MQHFPFEAGSVSNRTTHFLRTSDAPRHQFMRAADRRGNRHETCTARDSAAALNAAD